MDYYGAYQYGYSSLSNMIYQWQEFGIFDILLPLIFIFVLVFAILDRSKILGDARGVNVIISLVIAFFAISNNYVSMFFHSLFANTIIALAFLVGLGLLVGLFINRGDYWKYGAIVGIVAFLFVLGRTLKEMAYATGTELNIGYGISNFFSNPTVIFLIILGICIAVVVIFTKKKEEPIGKIYGK